MKYAPILVRQTRRRRRHAKERCRPENHAEDTALVLRLIARLSPKWSRSQ